MKVALRGIPDRKLNQPDDVVTMHVNNYSGLAMTGSSPGGREEFFEKGSEPSATGQQESVLFDNGDIKSTPQQTPSTSTSAAASTSPTGAAGTDDIF